MESKTTKKAGVKGRSAGSKTTTAAAEAATSPVKKALAKPAAAEKTPVKARAKKKPDVKKIGVSSKTASVEPEVEVSPAFKTLSEPALPALKRENRARLMMQTPAELYFYWSVRENPYHLLKQAFGSDTGSYTLVLKLTESNTGEEEMHPAEAEGSWWFNVAPNGKYEAEIGFYAPNRPYFRIIHSNTIETPRRNPSPHRAIEAVWTVSANKFAEVLDVAGFAHDAVDVVMAGDDHQAAESAAHTAFARFSDSDRRDLRGITGEDIRYVLRALASGLGLEELRHSVAPRLFAVLQANADKLSAERAMTALSDYYDIDEPEYYEEIADSTVFGASLVNFPRTLRSRGPGSKLSPVGSHSLPLSIGRR